jgi:hypothetical protein
MTTFPAGALSLLRSLCVINPSLEQFSEFGRLSNPAPMESQ